jgi:hypothetical protein
MNFGKEGKASRVEKSKRFRGKDSEDSERGENSVTETEKGKIDDRELEGDRITFWDTVGFRWWVFLEKSLVAMSFESFEPTIKHFSHQLFKLGGVGTSGSSEGS